MKRRAAWAIASGLLLAATLAPPAQAGTYIGGYSNPAAAYCAEDTVHAQQSVSSTPGYEASAPGVITWWITATTPEPGHTLQLIVLRRRFPPSGVGHFYTAIAKDVVRSLSSTATNSFTGVRLPIEAGQELGLYVPAGQPDVTYMGRTAPAGVCLYGAGLGGPTNQYRSHPGDPPIGTELDYTTAGNPFRLNVRAYIEADGDRDGFGDETQDGCPSNPAAQGACPLAAPFRGIGRSGKKKCKRKKKRGKAAVAGTKRKGCKRKRRK